ncbi:MAG: substrate-binding domain-containing protein [Victivallales bacterium]|jgi:DNA-binding LacI/PurR family transcriptional regulator|nr:substrate-binding domain-containing protein [Victivallales bacterium]
MAYHCKTSRLIEIFLADLAGERFKDEEFLPSAERLAELYSASRNTIRRMLSELENDGFLERRENRRIIASRASLVPKQKSSENQDTTIAFLYSGSSDSNIVRLTRGIEAYVAERELKLCMFADHHGHDSILKILQSPLPDEISGVLVVGHPIPGYTEAVNRLVNAGVPVVLIGERGQCRCSSVSGDDFSGIFSITSMMIRKYNRPACFIGPPGNAEERFRAFRQAMTDAGYLDGLEERILILKQTLDEPDHWDMQDKMMLPARLARPFLSRQKFPASVVCANDYIAYGVYEAATELGLKIGKDLAVAGFDDMPFACRLKPALSTVRVDVFNMGYQAVWLLDRLIRRELSAPQHMLLTAKVIERKSY